MNQEETHQQNPDTNPGQAKSPGVWQDIVTRTKKGERETILAFAAVAVSLLYISVGVSGGTLFTSLFLMNLGLIGWLGNTAYSRRKNNEGNGLAILMGIALALTALQNLYLASALTDLLTRINTVVSLVY